MTDPLVAVLGRGVVPYTAPLLASDDLGLTRGDGCFDAVRIVVADGGVRVDHLERHLERFARSALALELPPPDLPAWRGLIEEALAAWTGQGEAVLKLMLTRGTEHPGAEPSALLTITTAPDASRARSGVTGTTLCRGHASDAFAARPWLLGGVKSLSYAVNVAAKREATRRGADEAVFTSTDGYLLEGPTSGLLVAADDQLWTTPLGATGILESVTIGVITDLARADGVAVASALFRPTDLTGAEGAWLVSAIRGVLPLVSLDGVPIPHNPAITKHLATTAGF